MNINSRPEGPQAAIGARLRDLRQKLGLTLQDVADPLGVTRSCICQWESGRSHPRHQSLEALAAVLRTSVLFLLTGADLASPDSQAGDAAYVMGRARCEIAAALGLKVSQIRIFIDGAGSGTSDEKGKG